MHHIHDPHTRCILFDTLVALDVKYGSEIRFPGLSDREIATLICVQTLMISRMIRANPTTPYHILCVEFTVPPMILDALFRIVTLIHRITELQTSQPHTYIVAALSSWLRLVPSPLVW